MVFVADASASPGLPEPTPLTLLQMEEHHLVKCMFTAEMRLLYLFKIQITFVYDLLTLI
jgi:hypothetical protein